MKKAQRAVSARSLSRDLLTLWLIALLGAGCGTAAQPQPTLLSQATISPVSSEINRSLTSIARQTSVSSIEYRLGPEDLLQITLFNVPETEVGTTPRRLEVRVSQQGVITLPLLGDITVAGLTTSALEQTLQERYKEYLRNPQIGVFVKEYRSQRISVIGQVGKPGVFELTGPKTLIDLLAMAGGVSAKAGRQVLLYRQKSGEHEISVIDLYALTHNVDNVEAVNLPVQSGDVINVPEAGTFFIDGAVRSPGPFPLNRPYTLTQALSNAGGVDRELAKTSSISIIRHLGLTEGETIPVNLDEIQAGKAADPQIEAEDVIIVPMSAAKYFVKRFVGTLISGFSISPW